ncbi:STAS domain-containing protein [Nocardia sp. NPDC058058]|uniref:STAS domain-containing protein n=1 Tax=Nocardia sp. NPDC058058 TaxID=3346317 RepID=UPI0036DA33F1
MSASATALTTSLQRVGSISVLKVDGEIDLVSSPRFGTALAEALSEHPAVLVVDMAGVGFCGSVGISALLGESEPVPDTELRIVASMPVRRLIEVAGMDEVLPLFDTLEAACATS